MDLELGVSGGAGSPTQIAEPRMAVGCTRSGRQMCAHSTWGGYGAAFGVADAGASLLVRTGGTGPGCWEPGPACCAFPRRSNGDTRRADEGDTELQCWRRGHGGGMHCTRRAPSSLRGRRHGTDVCSVCLSSHVSRECSAVQRAGQRANKRTCHSPQHHLARMLTMLRAPP